MRCDQVMKRDLECVAPGDTVDEAACRMRDANVGFLPVCEQSMKVLGTITDRDITIRVVAEKKPSNTRVSDVMTREVIACRPGDDLQDAEELMARHHKSRIMCIDNGRLVGVISLSDIAQKERGARASDTLRKISEREARV
jgi:CBS domain-containing protein